MGGRGREGGSTSASACEGCENDQNKAGDSKACKPPVAANGRPAATWGLSRGAADSVQSAEIAERRKQAFRGATTEYLALRSCSIRMIEWKDYETYTLVT